MAHHDNFAKQAMYEVGALEEAVQVALDQVNLEETLIIVTADHSHAFTMNGYPERGNDILGFANKPGVVPYETLAYTNGPGFLYHRLNDTNYPEIPNQTWRSVADDPNRDDPFYRNFAGLYLEDETHGGEDVPVYAIGEYRDSGRPGSSRGLIDRFFQVPTLTCSGAPSSRVTSHTQLPTPVAYRTGLRIATIRIITEVLMAQVHRRLTHLCIY